MATQETKPTLLPFDGGGIPQFLKDQKRWAPWKAVFNEKRGKFDKIPFNPNHPEYGISTAAPERWASYDTALDAYKAGHPLFAGVGYVMTKPHGIVGADLDNCIVDGEIAPWALAVVQLLDTYTEISPSGKGLRMFGKGEVADWTNHQVGIEVYGGIAPRFLTITGTRVKGTPAEIRQLVPAALAALRSQYGQAVRNLEIDAADMPDLLPDALTPDIQDLGLPYFTRDFLEVGETRGDDRSGELHAAAISLFQAGLAEQEVLSVLAANPFSMEVALDHRRQDCDKATLYLWKEHCQKAKGKAQRSVASLDDFEVIEPVETATGEAPAKPKEQRFRVQEIGEFLKRPKANWLIKGVLPKAGLAVVFGESGSGKTFFVLDMVAAVARGIEWRGHRTRQGRGVYICAEGEAGFRNRMDAYCQFNGLDNMPIGVVADAPNLLEKADVKDLLAALKAYGTTDIIIVDTFAQVMPGANENSGEDVGRALAHCKAIHRITGAMVVLVHHSGKDASKGARGWSGLRAAADAEIEVQRSDHHRAATVTKLKDGEDGAEFGFKLETLAIGTDDDGDETSSCVVVHGSVVRKAAAPKGNNEKIVLRTLQDIHDLTGSGVTVSVLIDNAVAQIPFDEGSGKRDKRREHITRAIESLIAAKRISNSGGEICIN